MTQEQLREVVAFLEETPEQIRLLASGLASEELRWKPSADEFSVLEQVCHLRDLEREGYGKRISRLLSESEPLLTDFDGGRLAKERDYNSQSYESGLGDFARARDLNLRLVKTLSPNHLLRSGVLDGVGAITLGRLLLLMQEHDQSHLDELKDLRARMPGRPQQTPQYLPV